VPSIEKAQIGPATLLRCNPQCGLGEAGDKLRSVSAHEREQLSYPKMATGGLGHALLHDAIDDIPLAPEELALRKC